MPLEREGLKMNKQAIINEKIQSTQTKAVPLRTAIKEVLIHLYCRGVIPESVTQNVYDILKLKNS